MSFAIEGTISTQNLNPNSGVPTANSAVTLKGGSDNSNFGSNIWDTVVVQLVGTYTGALTPQVSQDGTNWIALGPTALMNVNTEARSSTIASAAVGIFAVNVAGFVNFRLSANAAVTGSVKVTLFATEATGLLGLAGALPGGANTIGTVNLGTAGTSATSVGKAEDAAAASGDTLVAVGGVRIPTTPVAQTSAAADYGTLAIDQEGKVVVTPYAGMEVSWQANPLTLSTTTSTALKAAAAAGVRNYITDIDIANTSATGVRVDILDNVTIIRSFWVPPTTTVSRYFSMPIRGTAATALNVQLSAAVTDVRVAANGYIGL